MVQQGGHDNYHQFFHAPSAWQKNREREGENWGKGEQTSTMTSKQLGSPIAPLLALPSLERNCVPCVECYKLHPATAAAAQLKEDHLLGGLIPRRGKLRHKSKEGRGQKYANNKEGKWKWSSRCERAQRESLCPKHTTTEDKPSVGRCLLPFPLGILSSPSSSSLLLPPPPPRSLASSAGSCSCVHIAQ